MAGFSSFCSNEFRTLIFRILTFGLLRKYTKPQDIHSLHFRSYLYGQMPKNFVLVAVLIITQKNLKTQKGTLRLGLESPRGSVKGWIILKCSKSWSASSVWGPEQDPLLVMSLFPGWALWHRMRTSPRLISPRITQESTDIWRTLMSCICPFKSHFWNILKTI